MSESTSIGTTFSVGDIYLAFSSQWLTLALVGSIFLGITLYSLRSWLKKHICLVLSILAPAKSLSQLLISSVGETVCGAAIATRSIYNRYRICFGANIDSSSTGTSTTTRSPQELASVWSKLTYSWLNDLLKIGSQRRIKNKDLIYLQSKYKSDNISKTFQIEWEKELLKFKNNNHSSKEKDTDENENKQHFETYIQSNYNYNFRNSYSIHNSTNSNNCKSKNEETVIDTNLEKCECDQFWSKRLSNCFFINININVVTSIVEIIEKLAGISSVKPSLKVALVKAFGKVYMVAGLVKLLVQFLSLLNPVWLSLYLESYENGDRIYSCIYAISMVFCNIFVAVMQPKYAELCMITCMNVRTALLCVCYDKIFKLTPSSQAKNTMGMYEFDFDLI